MEELVEGGGGGWFRMVGVCGVRENSVSSVICVICDLWDASFASLGVGSGRLSRGRWLGG